MGRYLLITAALLLVLICAANGGRTGGKGGQHHHHGDDSGSWEEGSWYDKEETDFDNEEMMESTPDYPFTEEKWWQKTPNLTLCIVGSVGAVIVTVILLSLYFCKKANRRSSPARVSSCPKLSEKSLPPPDYDSTELDIQKKDLSYETLPNFGPVTPATPSGPPSYSSIDLREGNAPTVIMVQPAYDEKKDDLPPKY